MKSAGVDSASLQLKALIFLCSGVTFFLFYSHQFLNLLLQLYSHPIDSTQGYYPPVPHLSGQQLNSSGHAHTNNQSHHSTDPGSMLNQALSFVPSYLTYLPTTRVVVLIPCVPGCNNAVKMERLPSTFGPCDLGDHSDRCRSILLYYPA